ncbi:MAG: hypothetical protein J6V50_01475 [Clostridia bacterium]|nr:hypothetical protein [Clostridia bacterium]
MNIFDSFKVLLSNIDPVDSVQYDLVDLGQLKLELKNREDSFIAQQEELELREKLLCERELNINLREKQLGEAIKSREEAFKEKEAELIAREEQLERKIKENELISASRIAKYKEATERYVAERRLWEETVNMKETPTANYEEMFREIVESFKILRSSMDNTKDAIVDARDAVRSGFSEGILKLCTLYRDMYFTLDPRLKEMADNLGVILMSEFEVSPIEPMAGSEFSSELHERIDTTKRGDVIAFCRIRGWSLKGKTLLRAVVETTEGENR